MNANNGGPAFPQPIVDTRGNSGIVSAEEMQVGGMTLRDYFAAKAMQGLIASHEEGYWWKCNSYTMGARYSYRFADAMLKERDK